MGLLNLPRIFGKKETESGRPDPETMGAILSERADTEAIVTAQEQAWQAIQARYSDDDQKRRQAYTSAQTVAEQQRFQEAIEEADQKESAKDLEEHWQSLVDYFLMVEDPLELGDRVPYGVEHAWIKKDKPALVLKIDLLSEPIFCALPESEPADLIQVAKALKLFVTSHYQPVTAEEVSHW